MSGPYRFQQESTKSPLDRQPPNLFPAGQPPSFKTNVNRMKTKKWVEAKKNAYDGDDWGEYDEYDEYGVDTPPPPPQQPPAPTGFRHPGQRIDQSSRSFTDPQRQGPPQLGRRNSFESGDEHRSFSAAAPPPQNEPFGDAPQQSYPNQAYGVPPQQSGPRQYGHRQASAAESDTSDTPQHRRDFSPSALPPPLHTRVSPAPGSATDSPGQSQFPPRKSSIGQTDSPTAISPRDRAPSNPSKPLPFIRPADIYKRVEEERQRERASLDSSRPSLDSLPAQPKEDVISPQGPSTSQQPSLPQMHGISAFDSDFWSSGPQSQAPTGQAPLVSPPQDPGFRSVVDQAFTRSDDQRSVPPTPISKSDGDMSRSNTTSTSGISPIMSRVPSSATSALKDRNNAGLNGSTPVIAEEASETSTPVSRPTSSAMLGGPYQVPRKPSPAHSRNVSSSSVPRAGLATPSPGESPARSPAIEPQRAIPEPESAVLTSLNSASHEAMEGGSGGPSPTYATREADIATAIKMSPDKAVPELSAAEKESQAAFLESHQNAQSPLQDTAPRSRSESPSKGRVQELAGKFGEVSHSRRGSTQSNASRNSIQSWERSRENSRPSSPTKPDDTTERPVAAREASFRPKLPGQWESYATSVPTPSEYGEQGLNVASEKGPTTESYQARSPLDEVDLTPTTTKHSVPATDPSKSSSEPLAALKAAGTAIGDALQASVGLGSSTSDRAQDKEGHAQDRVVGDVYQSRPIHLDRTASSVASSMPPTPPAKDTPESEDLPPPPPLKEKSPEPTSPISSSSQQQTPVRPTIIPQLSTDPSEYDQESDRLRKEIVASLSPTRTLESVGEPGRASLQPHALPAANRESSILPSEYDSYWADGDHASPRPSHDNSRNIPDHGPSSVNTSPTATKSTAPQLGQTQPSLLTRFSWENNASNLMSPDGQAQAGAAAEATSSPQEAHQAASPTSQSGAIESSRQSFGAIPEPYFGPGHTEATSITEPISDSGVTVRSPTPPLDSAKPVDSISRAETVREASPPASGLHVVNSDLNPEAVDLPPRLSADVSPAADQPKVSQEEPSSPKPKEEPQSASDATPAAGAVSGPSTVAEPVAKSPTDKPLGFKEIVNIKSPSERIVTYNQTREYWANADHGLNDWIASAMAANPELSSQSVPQPRPQIAHSGTSRHKPTGSLSLFGKHHGSNNDQANSAAAQSPATPSSSTAAPESRPFGSGSGGAGTRSASHQMQAKGKDLLHTAGVLGGKGMTSAKGLFAKGKSRFRASGSGDKEQSESATSSREASEEPELVTTPERGARMSMDLDNSKETKKKRRLSSPFHRSSRSRSRPSSIALPWNAHLDFGIGSTPRSTPPRETPPAEESRPYSYHAPESWNIMHDPQEHVNPATPPRDGLMPPDRLGVLPSPAKSAFSLVPQDKETDTPPVPPIPDEMIKREKSRTSEDSANHRMLQSVIRYSTPPAMESSKLRELSLLPDSPSDKAPPQDAPPQDAPPQGEPPQDVPHGSRDSVHGQIEGENGRSPQSHHDPPPPQLSIDSQGISNSPTAARNSIEGNISPSVSSMGPDHLDGEENGDDRPSYLGSGSLMQTPQPSRGDVSPMITAVAVPVIKAEDDRETPKANNNDAQGDIPAYLTKQIGAGDVSPISTTANDDEEPTPTKAMTNTTARQTSDFALEVDQAFQAPAETGAGAVAVQEETFFLDSSSSSSEIATEDAGHSRDGLAAPRVSASPTSYQVVHAVLAVPYVPSHSSFESWEQDSVAAPSQSDGSQLGDKHEDREIPPLPPVTNLGQHQESAKQNPHQQHKSSDLPASSKAAEDHPAHSMSPQQEPHQPSAAATAATPAGHKRSQSLLSAISSAVSAEGAPISPTSSQPTRSRPSSRGRQLQGPSAKNSPAAVPTQITEEASLPNENPLSTTTTNDEEYDLYADHNGIVKDVQDDQGQPLRVATTQSPDVSPPSQATVTPNTQSQGIVPPQEEDPGRYSDERPMSFVWGPRDANGRAQDHINKPTETPPVPPLPAQIPMQPHQREPHQNGPVSSANKTTPEIQNDTQSVQGHQAQPLPSVRVEGHDISPPNNSLRSQNGRSPPQSNVSPPPPSNASPPPQPTPPQNLAARPFLHDPRIPNGAPADPRIQDPRMLQHPSSQDPRYMVDPRLHGIAPGQPHPHDPRLQMPGPGQMTVSDPRIQGQGIISSPPPPRNQYELQQQMMQQQAIDPRMRGALPSAGMPQQSIPQVKQEEKSSSRPKLSSVFKGLSSRSSSNTAQTPNQPNDGVESSLPAPEDPNRATSFQSSVGNLPAESLASRKNRRKSGTPGLSGNRPVSVGTESHISHISQDSTKVQAADSRLDLRYPASPAPFKGIPPQLPPPGAPAPPKAPQPQRVSSSGAPEGGKKKRFSALGALFSRSSTTGHAHSTKPKLSKEEKKAQKAQKHSTLPPMQPPQAQQWPQPQPQQQYGMQYGPPPSARPFPGMQGVQPQMIPPQSMPHPGSQPQRPQQLMQPQGYQQPQQQQQQIQMQMPRRAQDGSAYLDTRRIAQAYQSQQSSRPATQSSSQVRHGMSPTNSSLEQPPGSMVHQPPPGGYYIPEEKKSLPGPGPSNLTTGQQQQPQQNFHPQQAPNSRRVSSPASTLGANVATPASQRRVSSPSTEPQYETPQIPAAYRHVTGAYVSPGAQSPADAAQPQPYPPQYGGRAGRQYSDPHMQALSPQVSQQSQFPPDQRSYSNASSVSVMSPSPNPSPAPPTSPPVTVHKNQKPRMSSISEATQPERPWNLDLPPGATEQDIVRARHQQYMEQQLAAQQQLQAERAAQSPSPHHSRHTKSPSPQPSASAQQETHQSSSNTPHGGFREVLPRSSPQPYPMSPRQEQNDDDNRSHDEQQRLSNHSQSPQPLQPAPLHPEQTAPPAAYPLPMSPDSASVRSPVNPLAGALPPPPPPKIPHSPMRPGFSVDQPPAPQNQYPPAVQSQQFESPLPSQQPNYEEQPPDEPPPSYSGPGVPNDGMEKDRPRPPNIMTDADIRGRDFRHRQASIGMLQHPQPASMAASPQRSSADMGADILRRQLLEQEEQDRVDRMQRAEIQRAESERERQERERNRARARELERSISGGGRVGSLRSVGGSRSGVGPGWERRGSTTRPVFELPAEEDDEPVMRATSFPGQEWVPTFTED